MESAFYSDDGKNTDVCAWNYPACSDGRISALFLSSPHAGADFVLDMDWLPLTIQHLHLQTILMADGWVAFRLPRDLNYLYMSYAVSCTPKTNRSVDFRHLPLNLEELFLFMFQRGWFSGNVNLTDLPPKLRVLWIDGRPEQPWKATIDYAKLPESLKYLWLAKNHDIVPIANSDGNLVHGWMSKQNDIHDRTAMPNLFKYCLLFPSQNFDFAAMQMRWKVIQAHVRAVAKNKKK